MEFNDDLNKVILRSYMEQIIEKMTKEERDKVTVTLNEETNRIEFSGDTQLIEKIKEHHGWVSPQE